MLSGVELITTSVGRIAELKPAIVKARFPGQLPFILGAAPGAKVLTRPESEGLDAFAILEGYRQWHEAFAAAGAMDRWFGHELSNEPNHPNHDPFWAERGGPSAYLAECRRALVDIKTRWGNNAIERCYLGGLVPFLPQPWATTYDRLQVEFPGLKRAAHLYTPFDHGDVFAQLSGKLAGAIITETNISEPWKWSGTQTENNAANFERAAREGMAACVLFCHEAGPNGEWKDYVPSLEDQRRILAAGNAVPAPAPTPQPQPAPTPAPVPGGTPMPLSNPFAIPGVGAGFVETANKADAVIDSTELQWMAAKPGGDVQVGTKVHTDKGWIHYSPETGFRGPFAEAA